MMWINGAATPTIDARDRGLQYGDGVFTTLRVHASKPVFLERHIARLTRDCERLRISPPDPRQLADEIRRACLRQPRAVLKVILTRGVSGRGYHPAANATPTRIVQRHAWPAYDARNGIDGVRLRLCATRLGENEALAGVKHLNRLEQVLARAEWTDPGIADGVMVSHAGKVIETTSANLFIVHGGTVMTPALGRCGVRGVMREVMRELTQHIGLVLAERTFHVEDLTRADELFITNSIIGVWPVNQFQETTYRVGKITRQLMEALARFEPAYA